MRKIRLFFLAAFIAAAANQLFASTAAMAVPSAAASRFQAVESALSAGGGAEKIAAAIRSSLSSLPEHEIELTVFEVMAIKKDFPAAEKHLGAAFEAFKRSGGAGAKRHFGETLAAYGAFARTLSEPIFAASVPKAPEAASFRTPVLKLFFERYARRAEAEAKRAAMIESSPDYISFLEKENLGAGGEGSAGDEAADGAGGEFPAEAARLMAGAMKDPEFMNFLAGRPLLLFMLYSNVGRAGDDFLREFLKSFIETNVPPSLRRESGFAEFSRPAAETGSAARTLVCDFSSASFFFVPSAGPPLGRAALVSGALGKTAVASPDFSAFKRSEALFSDASVIFPLDRGRLGSVKFSGKNWGEAVFADGARVVFKLRIA